MIRTGMPGRTTFFLCTAEVFGLAGIATFPALLPTFKSLWHLSNTEAGWISSVYFLGYMLSVPVLTGLTDRTDARTIVIAGNLLSALSALGFAFFADSFLSAFLWRFVAGIALAGIYMPGLKMVSDGAEGPTQSRHVAFYTASFSIGSSLSYLMAGEIAARAGWKWTFGLSGVVAMGALPLLLVFTSAKKPSARKTSFAKLLDFRPVLKNGPVMAYVLAYASHMWELFAMRSWVVAFLVFSQHLPGAGDPPWTPTQIAFAVNLIGLPAGFFGNEAARRLGRRKFLNRVMISSAALGAVMGFSAPLPPLVVVAACLIYGVTVTADSASLTAGTVLAAPPEMRGAALAVHSTIGFGAAFLGPLAVGVVLDLCGGMSVFSWGMAFLTMGLGCAVGPFILRTVGIGQAKMEKG